MGAALVDDNRLRDLADLRCVDPGLDERLLIELGHGHAFRHVFRRVFGRVLTQVSRLMLGRCVLVFFGS